jgi:hypothetical protein
MLGPVVIGWLERKALSCIPLEGWCSQDCEDKAGIDNLQEQCASFHLPPLQTHSAPLPASHALRPLTCCDMYAYNLLVLFFLDLTLSMQIIDS